MQDLLKEEKASRNIFLIIMFTYTVICMAKAAFSASIVGIVSDGLFTKSKAGIINGAFFIFYGGGQLFCGRLVDKISPHKMITIAIAGALLMIAAMSVSSNFYIMLALWSFSGMIQFGMWPSVVRIISQYMVPEHRKKAMMYVAFASTGGILLSFMFATLFLRSLGWRWIFYTYTVILIITLLVWLFVAKRHMQTLSERRDKEFAGEELKVSSANNNFLKLILVSGLLALLIPTFIRQILSTLSTWVPTLIKETYGVSQSFASSLNTILSVVNLSGIFFVNYLYPKHIKNIVLVYAISFALMIPSTVLLTLTGKISVWIVVLLLAVLTTLACGAAQCINVIIPSSFAKYNRAGSVAALLNALGSFGSVASSTGIGIMADKIGWHGTIVSWVLIAILAAVMSFCAVPIWKRFTAE